MNKRNHMKKSMMITTVALMTAIACQAQSKLTSGYLTIKGKLTDVKDTLVVYGCNYDDPRGVKLTDLVTKDGKFEYKVQLDQPKNILFYRPFSQQKGNSIIESGSIPAIPGETVELTGTVTSYQIKGTGFYKQYANLHSILRDFYQTMFDENKQMTAVMKSTQNDSAKNEAQKAYAIKMKAAQDKLIATLTTYLKNHKNEEASAYVASLLPVDSLDMVLNTLSPDITHGRLSGIFAAVKERKQAMETQKEAQKDVLAGKMAPDFTLKDIQGKDFTLSSLRGKYVILDFWGSWCVWCIKGMPKMKEYYEKYKGKFEIVGVDCQDTEAKWKAAVEKNQLPWLHVKNETQDLVPEKYAVTAYPTKVLINPDGTINKTIVGESEDFYQYLDSLFGTK